MSPINHRAFSLIELLIVVAIIAILAAIAVPNFLEAQTRSKVSRAKSDMRSLATAIEAYGADNDGYPEFLRPPWVLTTPVSYISALPQDIFRKPDPSQTGVFAFIYPLYRYGSMPLDTASRWVLDSVGPDQDMDVYISTGSGFDPDATALIFYPGWTQDLFSPTGAQVNTSRMQYIQYDPTNGTVSSGDIFRFSDHQND